MHEVSVGVRGTSCTQMSDKKMCMEYGKRDNVMSKISNGISDHVRSLFQALHADWAILSVLIPRTWRSKGKGGIFSLLWQVATPLFLLAVYYCAFGMILNIRQDVKGIDYALYMFSGMAFFNVFAESLQSGAHSIISRPGYVHNATFDLEVLPLTAVGCAFLTGLCWFAVVFAAAGTPGLRLLYLALVLIPFCAFCIGVAFFSGAISVYLRDFPQFAVLLQQGLFFLTPIVYPVSVIPPAYRSWIFLNPLTVFVEAFRAAVFELPLERVGRIWIIGFSFCLSGVFFFHKTRKGFIDAV